MRRFTLLLAALAFLAPTATAHAQEIVVDVREFTDRPSPNLDRIGSLMGTPITRAECDLPAEIRFRFTQVDQNRTNLFFYEGTGCEDIEIRSTTTDDRCVSLTGPYPTEMRTEVDVTLEVGEIVPCDDPDARQGTVNVMVLAMNNETSDEVTGAGQMVSFDIAYDFDGPAAPSNFEVRGGETSMTLSWEGGADHVTEYEVYVDPNGCTDGTPSGPLVDDPDNPPASLLVTTIDGPSSGGAVPFPDSVSIPGEAAVAVRAFDRSMNPGALSAVRCVDRFEVTTWLETYCADGAADACDGAGCAVSTGAGSTAPLAALALAFGLAAWRRRRR